ncbi:hypothetical protein FRC17_006608 [Serendipita sp. 399]|nr:hypothetical protein FRC17_006608 [Serendipita sp. 399]
MEASGIVRLLKTLALCLLLSSVVLAERQAGTGPPSTGAKKYVTARTLRGAGIERDIELGVPLRTHSIFAPYVDSDLQNRWFSFGADSYVNTNKHIRLTRGVPSQCGWLWSRLPITAANWQVEIEFKISGENSHLYGDGMAVWLTTERAVEGPTNGTDWGCYANSHHTYAFPRIMAMMGDGNTEYDQGNDGKLNSIGACSAKVRRTDITTKLRMIYFRDDFFQVQVQYKGFNDWTDCFVIRNLSLPLNPFLGVTAQTGDVFDEHDVIAITAHSAKLASVQSPLTENTSSKGGKKSGGGGFFSTLLKLIFFGTIVAVGFVAFRAYQAKKHRPWDPKRF